MDVQFSELIICITLVKFMYLIFSKRALFKSLVVMALDRYKIFEMDENMIKWLMNDTESNGHFYCQIM